MIPQIRPILPKSDKIIDIDGFDRSVERMLDMVSEDMRIDFDVTIQTWRNRPLFLIEKNQSKKWTRSVYTRSKIYKFVSRGTRIRYATMTKDFRAKTVPKVLASRKGRGGLAYINKLKPRPGIKAREFEDEIIKKWLKRTPQMLEHALSVELRKQNS